MRETPARWQVTSIDSFRRKRASLNRLVTLVRYQGGVLMIRFFGSHEEYDQIDAETV
jgi:hypothetical protein